MRKKIVLLCVALLFCSVCYVAVAKVWSIKETQAGITYRTKSGGDIVSISSTGAVNIGDQTNSASVKGLYMGTASFAGATTATVTIPDFESDDYVFTTFLSTNPSSAAVVINRGTGDFTITLSVASTTTLGYQAWVVE